MDWLGFFVAVLCFAVPVYTAVRLINEYISQHRFFHERLTRLENRITLLQKEVEEMTEFVDILR